MVSSVRMPVTLCQALFLVAFGSLILCLRYQYGLDSDSVVAFMNNPRGRAQSEASVRRLPAFPTIGSQHLWNKSFPLHQEINEACRLFDMPLLVQAKKRSEKHSAKNRIHSQWSSSDGDSLRMCLRDYEEYMSAETIKNGQYWDCAVLLSTWRFAVGATASGGKDLSSREKQMMASLMGFNETRGFLENKPLVHPRRRKGVKSRHGDEESDKPIFVDVGANIGLCSILIMGWGAPTIMFEPSPPNLFYLTTSLLLNDQRFTPSSSSLSGSNKSVNYELFTVGLADEDRTDFIHSSKKNSGHSIVGVQRKGFTEKYKISIRKLDDMLWADPEDDPPHVGLLKIDVEGYETFVLKGAQRLLAAGAIKLMQIEFVATHLLRVHTSPEELCQLLIDNGYRLRLTNNIMLKRVTILETGQDVAVPDCRKLDVVANVIYAADLLAIHRSVDVEMGLAD